MRAQTITNLPLLKFCQNLEEIIQEEIDEAYPVNWDEDYITRRLVVALRSMEHSQVEVLNTFNSIFITPFKLKGTNENKFGDLAIIVDTEFKDGDKLKGVAFLEAKRIYEGANEYTALEFDQLKRIYTNAPNSRLLLYNYKPMSTLAPTGLDTKQSASGILPKMPVTYTSVANVNTVIKLNEKNERLHKVSIPFSYQFCFRYLYGKDLEFDDDSVRSAQGYITDKIGTPTYVVIVTIKPAKRGQKEIGSSVRPEINRDLYAEIRDVSNFKK